MKAVLYGARIALILFFLSLILPLPAAMAEANVEKIVDSLELDKLEELSEETSGMDVRGMIVALATGDAGLDLDGAVQQAKALFVQEWKSMLLLLPGLMVPALISALTRRLSRLGKGADAAQFLCYLTCALSQISLLILLLSDTKALISRISSLSDAVFPILTGLIALSGATATASMLSPLAAILAKLIAMVFGGVGMQLCSIAAAVAVAGNLNKKLSLKNLFTLINSTVNWAAGIIMTGFLGVMSVQGLLGAGYDSASVRAARYAVDNLLPVIGGEVADTMDALVSSVLLVKNAAGVTGMLLLIAVCARPLLRIVAALLSLKFSAAVLEPLAEEGLTKLTEQFSKVVQMLLILSSACIVLLLLLLGAILTAGGGVVR